MRSSRPEVTAHHTSQPTFFEWQIRDDLKRLLVVVLALQVVAASFASEVKKRAAWGCFRYLRARVPDIGITWLEASRAPHQETRTLDL